MTGQHHASVGRLVEAVDQPLGPDLLDRHRARHVDLIAASTVADRDRQGARAFVLDLGRPRARERVGLYVA